ncbi:FecR domain-containing protein [Chloroflexota bacterium]
MKPKLSKVLDECLARISKGETADSCLADYANLRERLDPLLSLASSVSDIPTSPPDEFREASKTRLLAQLRQDTVAPKTANPKQKVSTDSEAAAARTRLWCTAGWRKVAILATAAVALLLVFGLSLLVVLDPLSPGPAHAARCTLSILGGNIEFQDADSDDWQDAVDGLTLAIGTQIKTAQNSHAVLTFFDGSTIKLEPNTTVELNEIARTSEQSTTIVLKQSLGKTWSHPQKMGAGSYYEITTPAASIIAIGTLFSTHVDESGLTRVVTTEGQVSVVAQDEEVYVSANQQNQVVAGTGPSQAAAVPARQAEFVIATELPAVLSVRDPTGSSTGHLPSGLSFNQITGSQCSLSSDGKQAITIDQPVTGEYVVAVRYVAQETARLNIRMKSAGEVVFEKSDRLAGVKGEGWLIRINLQVEAGAIVEATVAGIERLHNQVPEKVVEPESVREELKQIGIRPDLSTIDKPGDDSSGEQDPGDKAGDQDASDDIGDNDVNIDSNGQDAGANSGDGDTVDADDANTGSVGEQPVPSADNLTSKASR